MHNAKRCSVTNAFVPIAVENAIAARRSKLSLTRIDGSAVETIDDEIVGVCVRRYHDLPCLLQLIALREFNNDQ